MQLNLMNSLLSTEALKSYSLQQHISPSVQNTCMRFIQSFLSKYTRLFIKKWLYECRYCWYRTKCSLVDLYRSSRQIFEFHFQHIISSALTTRKAGSSTSSVTLQTTWHSLRKTIILIIKVLQSRVNHFKPL